MTEPIDHAAEARRLVDITEKSYGSVEVRNGDMAVAQMVEAQMMAAAAQVHATLALVEQQRIANVIALSQVRVAPGEVALFRHLTIQPVGLSDVDIRADIKEGLGL